MLCRASADEERREPFNLVDDLWRLWSERAYLPGHRALAAEFSSEARTGLEQFTEFFRARLPLFPQRFESLMHDIHWRGVTEYANLLLDQLARDGKPSEEDR